MVKCHCLDTKEVDLVADEFLMVCAPSLAHKLMTSSFSVYSRTHVMADMEKHIGSL
jgi:hypothetical protein